VLEDQPRRARLDLENLERQMLRAGVETEIRDTTRPPQPRHDNMDAA
jgi:hypothetical protein